jgi:2'-5' RNA ligase
VPRLFVGTFLSPEQAESLANVQERNPNPAFARHLKTCWSNPEKLHLTWVFLGELDAEQMPALTECMADTIKDNVSTGKLALTFESLEVWSVGGEPRNLVLVPNQIATPFIHLAQALRQNLQPFVEKKCKEQALKPFRPHITMMRLQITENASSNPSNHPNQSASQPDQPDSALAIKHPLSGKTEVGEIDPGQILGLAERLPLKIEIDQLCLIESSFAQGTSQYKILKAFNWATL